MTAHLSHLCATDAAIARIVAAMNIADAASEMADADGDTAGAELSHAEARQHEARLWAAVRTKEAA